MDAVIGAVVLMRQPKDSEKTFSIETVARSFGNGRLQRKL